MITAAVAVAGAHAGPSLAAFGQLSRRLLPPRLSGIGRPGHVALTFNGGPDPRATPQLLRVLDRHDVRATFFLPGEKVERHVKETRDIVAAGHEVGVLGYQHRLLLSRLPRDVVRDLSRATAAITSVTGQEPRWWRPPYGLASSTALLTARCLGLTPVLWTCSDRRWGRPAGPEAVYRSVRRRLRGGGTVLMHHSDRAADGDSWNAVLGALPEILEICQVRGYEVGRLRDHGLPAVPSTL
ncbi:polysaccharide deacetylase family protein [Actinoplanes sp. NPDC048796]|uniref:polysaccharide deacetylase family protein n=1 Tax=unclassified Actinoplanes TaxID=2626549 RepID=UPI0033D5CB65